MISASAARSASSSTNSADLTRLGWNELTVRNLVDADAALATLFRMVLGVAITANLIEIGQQLYRLFFRKTVV